MNLPDLTNQLVIIQHSSFGNMMGILTPDDNVWLVDRVKFDESAVKQINEITAPPHVNLVRGVIVLNEE